MQACNPFRRKRRTERREIAKRYQIAYDMAVENASHDLARVYGKAATTLLNLMNNPRVSGAEKDKRFRLVERGVNNAELFFAPEPIPEPTLSAHT